MSNQIRSIQNRPVLRQTVQIFNATRADDLIGYKSQTVADGAAPPTGDVPMDPEANVFVSLENTTPITLVPPDLADPSTPWIARTFVNLGTQNLQVIPVQPVVAFAGVELVGAGSSATVIPYRLDDPSTPLIWLVQATFGTVNIIP